VSRKKFSEKISLGARLRQARKEAGLTQEALAGKVGFNKSHISLVETDQSGLSRLAVQAIAQALGVNSSWLLTGEGEMRPPAVRESATAYRSDLRTWEAALAPCLEGTPLEGGLGATLSVGPDWDAVWRQIPDPKKAEIRKTLRWFALASVPLEQLPERFASPVRAEFSRQLRAYIQESFSAYATSR